MYLLAFSLAAALLTAFLSSLHDAHAGISDVLPNPIPSYTPSFFATR
jgi:hypothetical protein